MSDLDFHHHPRIKHPSLQYRRHTDHQELRCDIICPEIITFCAKTILMKDIQNIKTYLHYILIALE